MKRPSNFLGLVALAALAVLVARPAKSASPDPGGMRDPIRTAMAEGRFDEARAMLEDASGGRVEGERLELLTEVCNALNDHEAGIRYGKLAIAGSPDSANAHLQYAVAVRTKMQNVSKVKAMFSIGTYKKELARARELDPQNLHAREEEIGFLTQAPGFAGGDVDRARDLAAELKTLHPRRGLAMEIEIETQEGDPARADALFREALAADPDDVRLRNRYAYHLQQQQKYREADEEFARVEAADNARAAQGALYQRARTRILGRYEQKQAVDLLKRYLGQVGKDESGLPSRSHAYWRMGNAHEQLEQFAEARAAYTKALELDPDNAEARKALKVLPR